MAQDAGENKNCGPHSIDGTLVCNTETNNVDVDNRAQMAELGLQHDTAWELYQALVEEADGDESLAWDNLPNWSGIPFYAKLRAEATRELLDTGKGEMYIGFHLDPLYRVHWNNEVDPVEFQITAPDGVSVTPAYGVTIDPEEPTDADPREFIVQVDAKNLNQPLDLWVQYFACEML